MPDVPDPITSLVDGLHQVDRQLDATAIADILWLSSTTMPHEPSKTTTSLSPPAMDGPTSLTKQQSSPTSNQPPPKEPQDSETGLFDGTLPPGDDATPRRGRPVRAPKARSLPRQVELARSLRPFRRPWPDGLETRLDLDATVQSYAHTRQLIPVFGPAPERWFEVDVVVDDAISMTVWDDTITEFIRLLHQVGAFRLIRRWSLTTNDTLMLRDTRGDPVSPDRLRSSDQRSTIVVLSDCCSDGWFTPAPWNMLRGLAQTTAVALINPLPSKMWARTGLDLPTVRVGPGSPGCRNTALRYRVPALFSINGDRDRHWLPIPATTLTPHTLGRWASTLMRSDPSGCDALLIPPNGRPELPPTEPDEQGEPPTAADFVEAFSLTASPSAVRLVTLCAPFTQISVPVLDVIRHALVPEATTADVAEVVVSGLFDTSRHNGHTTLTFRDGVQGELRNTLGVHDVWRTYRALTRHLANHSDAVGTFPAVVADPDGALEIPTPLLPFAEASRDLLRLLTQRQEGRKARATPVERQLAPPPSTVRTRTRDPELMLGAAVVKTACKVWLKDHDIAADPAVGVVEIIQAHVSEGREQRRARRFFEELEKRVADRVLANLLGVFANVPENERAVATLAVADSLDRANLTNEDLFAANLDAALLFRTVRPLERRFTKTLRQDTTELYERILHDCCAYVVEVVRVLSGFKVGVFSELLSRQHEIVRDIGRSLDRLPVQLGGASAEPFESSYLRLVANQLDRVELFGVTVSDRFVNYPLSVAYVSLSTRSIARPDKMAVPGARKHGRRVMSIEEALGETKRAFIRGEAGSGKTTLLQWLAVRSACRDFNGPMRGWNDCVPLFMRLRRYSETNLPRPEDFLGEVGRIIADVMPLNWVNDLLRSGRAMVLVDGVDELPESQRRRAREWLRELLMAYPACRYVVTSRPAAAAENWLDSEEFSALEIQPMNMADIEAFVTHWHAALAASATIATELERIQTARDALIQAIRTNRYLNMLVTSPLMATLICALHLERRMQLPLDQMELYSITLELLLGRRDSERDIRGFDMALTRNDKLLILEDLAYWLVRNGWSDASEDRALERLTIRLMTMPRVQASAPDVLNYMIERSGVLRSPVPGQLEFIHEKLREFLAARAAVAADDIGVLVQNAHNDQWREVFLMAVAQGRARQTEELLSMILYRADTDTAHQHTLRSLAVDSLQYATQLSPELHRRLQEMADPDEVTTPTQELTPRELEIARLVARGFTNQRIAEELYVSVRTVEKHLSRVFAKLGVTSRIRLADTLNRESLPQYEVDG